MSREQRTITFTGEDQRRYAHEVIDRVQVGSGRVWEAVIRPRVTTRKSAQNRLFHALIGDIHEQAFRGYRRDCLKAVFVSQFAAEKEEMGEPLRHPGATTWDWKRQCPVYVRPSTTDFSTAEAGDFIEYLYAEGAELGVTWSQRALAVYDEYKESSA